MVSWFVCVSVVLVFTILNIFYFWFWQFFACTLSIGTVCLHCMVYEKYIRKLFIVYTPVLCTYFSLAVCVYTSIHVTIDNREFLCSIIYDVTSLFCRARQQRTVQVSQP